MLANAWSGVAAVLLFVSCAAFVTDVLSVPPTIRAGYAGSWTSLRRKSGNGVFPIPYLLDHELSFQRTSQWQGVPRKTRHGSID